MSKSIATAIITASLVARSVVLEGAEAKRNTKDGVTTVTYLMSKVDGRALGLVKRSLGKEHGEEHSFSTQKNMSEDGKTLESISVVITNEPTANWKAPVVKAPARVPHSQGVRNQIQKCLDNNKDLEADALPMYFEDCVELVKANVCSPAVEGGLQPQMASRYITNNLAKQFEGAVLPRKPKPAKVEAEKEEESDSAVDDGTVAQAETEAAE